MARPSCPAQPPLPSKPHAFPPHAGSTVPQALEDTHAQMEGVTTDHAKLAFDAQDIPDENAVFAEQVTAQTCEASRARGPVWPLGLTVSSPSN